MNKFNINKKNMYIIMCILLISIFSLTIVYAALSVTLNIAGNAEVVASTWDVHLDNADVVAGSATLDSPTIKSSTTATFSTSLTTPGDFYEFTIDVVNDGDIDAMIDGVTKTPPLTTEQAKYLNYTIEYQSGESINTKQLVEKNSFVRLKVRVEYRKDLAASDLPTTLETLNLSFTINYVQSDGSGSIVNNNGINSALIKFTIDEIVYYAENGMTWYEWVDSKYNVNGFKVIVGGDIIDGEDECSVLYDYQSDSTVLSDFPISSDGVYYLGINNEGLCAN